MKVGVFSGQGVDARVVLAALEGAGELGEVASEDLGYPLVRRVRLCARTRAAKLPTELAQPAIFVASVKAWNEAADNDECEFLLGHSLGEYAALVAGESLTFRNALRVVAVRAQAMAAAGRGTEGGMAALLGVTLDQAQDIAGRAGALVANDNAPGQAVVAGPSGVLARVAGLANMVGARCVLLNVDAAFHTPAMNPARAALSTALEQVDVRSPKRPVISNMTARPYRAPGEIRKLLVDQVATPIRFREGVEWLWDQGVRQVFDWGPGKVAGPLVERTFRALGTLQHV